MTTWPLARLGTPDEPEVWFETNGQQPSGHELGNVYGSGFRGKLALAASIDGGHPARGRAAGELTHRRSIRGGNAERTLPRWPARCRSGKTKPRHATTIRGRRSVRFRARYSIGRDGNSW